MSRRSSLKGLEEINKNIIKVGNREKLFSWNELLDNLGNIIIDNDTYENQVRKIYDDIFYKHAHHSIYIQGDFLNFDQNQFDQDDIELIMISKKKDNFNNWTEKYENLDYRKSRYDRYENIINLVAKYNQYFDQTSRANINKIPIVIEISKETNSDIKFYLFFRIIKDSRDFRQKRRDLYDYKFTIDELLDTNSTFKDLYLHVKINDDDDTSVFEAIQRSKNKKMDYVKDTLIHEIREGFHNFSIYWSSNSSSNSKYYFEKNNNPYLNFNYIDSGYYINMLLPDEKYSFKSCHITFHNQAGYNNKIHFKFENDNKKVIYGTNLRIENYENDIANYFKFEVISNEYFVKKKNYLHQKTEDFLNQIMELTQRTISLYFFGNLNDAEYLNFIISNNKFNQYQIHEYLRTKFTTEKLENGKYHHYQFKINDKPALKSNDQDYMFEFTIIPEYAYELLMIEISIYERDRNYTKQIYNANAVGKIRVIPYIDENDNNLVKLFYVIDSDYKQHSNLLKNIDYEITENMDYSFFLSYLIDQDEFKRHIKIRENFFKNFDNYDLRVEIYSDTYVYFNYDDGLFYMEYKKIKEDKPLLRLDINLENFIKLDNYIIKKNFQNIFNNEKNKKIFKIEYIYDKEYFSVNFSDNTLDIDKLNDDDYFYGDNFNDMYQITNKLLKKLYIIDENYMYLYSLNKKIYDDILGRHLLYIGNYKSNKDEGIDFDKNHILRPGKIYNTFDKNYNFIIIKKKLENLTVYFFLYRNEKKKEIILLGISHYIDGILRVIELSNYFNKYDLFQNYAIFIKDILNYYMQIEDTEYIVHNKSLNLRNYTINHIFDNLNEYNNFSNFEPTINKITKDDLNYNDNSEKNYYLMDEHFIFYFNNDTIDLSYINVPLAKLYFRIKNENKIVDKLEFETNYGISTIYDKFTSIIQKKKLLINENALIVIKKYENIIFDNRYGYDEQESYFQMIDNILDIFYDKNIKIHVAEKNKQENDFEQIYFFTNINQDTKKNDNKYDIIFNLFQNEFIEDIIEDKNISCNFMIKGIEKKTLDDSDTLFKIDRFKGLDHLRIIFFDNNNFEDCNFNTLLDKDHLKNIRIEYFYTFKNFEANFITEKSNVSFFDTFPLIKFDYVNNATIIICRENIYAWDKICTSKECGPFSDEEIYLNNSDYQFNYEPCNNKKGILLLDMKFKYENDYYIVKNNMNNYNYNEFLGILSYYQYDYYIVKNNMNNYNDNKIKFLGSTICRILISLKNILPFGIHIDNNLENNNIFSIGFSKAISHLNSQNGGYFNKYIKYKKKYLDINFPNYDFKKEYIKNGIDYKTKYLKYKKKYLNNEK